MAEEISVMDLKDKLFYDCSKEELRILLKGLKSLDKSKLSTDEINIRALCMGTLYSQLTYRHMDDENFEVDDLN